jgi:hypothetical protein
VTATTTTRVIELLSSRDGDPAQVDGKPPQVGGDPPQVAGDPPQVPVQPPTEVRDFAPPRAHPAPSGPSSDEPAHVSEEPELVEEFAEPGAEEGAGAEVHVDPPWDGYELMNAKQVISRLASADPAELAAVELYEGTHRRRQTILNSAERELRRGSGSGSQTQERG